MVETRVFLRTNREPAVALEECVKAVNSLLSREGIKREAILEYRTEAGWVSGSRGKDFEYKVILSVWNNGDKECDVAWH